MVSEHQPEDRLLMQMISYQTYWPEIDGFGASAGKIDDFGVSAGG